MAELRALSVRQPWAGAIIWGGKDVENRSRPTSYRGQILIHAGKAHPDYQDYREAAWLAERCGPNGATEDPHLNWTDTRRVSADRLLRERHLPYSTSALGVILGCAVIADCHPADDCNHICPEPEDWDPASDSMPCTEHEGPCRNYCSGWAWPDLWHWVLKDVRSLAKPVPCRGALGLWRLPEDVERAVRAQLEVSAS